MVVTIGAFRNLRLIISLLADIENSSEDIIELCGQHLKGISLFPAGFLGRRL